MIDGDWCADDDDPRPYEVNRSKKILLMSIRGGFRRYSRGGQWGWQICEVPG